MHHSTYSEANSISASQEIPRILWNPKVHYLRHNRPPRISTLSQINPVHSIPFYFFKIHFNIILQFTLRYSKWPLLVQVSYQNAIRISLLPQARHMLRPFHPP
jgi:hypothetical protein